MPALTPFLASLGGTKPLRAPSPETPTTPPSPAPAPSAGLPLGQAPTQQTSPPLFPSLHPLCDMQVTLPGAAPAAPHRQPSRLGSHQSPPEAACGCPAPAAPLSPQLTAASLARAGPGRAQAQRSRAPKPPGRPRAPGTPPPEQGRDEAGRGRGRPCLCPGPGPLAPGACAGGRHMAAAAISCPGGPRPAAKMGWGRVYPSIFMLFPDLKCMYRRLFVQPERFWPSVTLQAFQAAV